MDDSIDYLERKLGLHKGKRGEERLRKELRDDGLDDLDMPAPPGRPTKGSILLREFIKQHQGSTGVHRSLHPSTKLNVTPEFSGIFRE